MEKNILILLLASNLLHINETTENPLSCCGKVHTAYVNLCSIYSNIKENGVFSAVLLENPNAHQQQIERVFFSILL